MMFPVAECCWVWMALKNISYPDFFYGIILGAALCALIEVIYCAVSRARKFCRQLVVADSEKGNFILSSRALGSFVVRSLDAFPALDVKKVELIETRMGMNLNLVITVEQGTDLVALRRQIREKLTAEFAAKLGITEQIAAIHIGVAQFIENPASDK